MEPFSRRSRAAVAALSLLLPLPLLCQYQSVTAQVSQPNYRHYLDELLFTRAADNRGPTGAQHDSARRNIRETLASFGLSVTEERFDYQGAPHYNITAVLPGKSDPSTYHVIGAHYDSKSNPGADDDASGIAALLEAARVASLYDFDASIVFVAFDLEEPGLLGSKAWVAAHSADRVMSMLQMDMIAFNSPGPNYNLIALCTPTAASNSASAAIWTAIADYGAPLHPVSGGSSTASDHASFSRIAPSVEMIEASFYSNRNYHHDTDSVDTPSYIDYDFATAAARSVVAYLAQQAGLRADSPPRLPAAGIANSASRIVTAVAPAELLTISGAGFGENPSVVIRDSAGADQPVPLRNVTGTRIDLLLPARLAPGAATLALTREDGLRLEAPLTVAAVAPGVFTADATGLGAPAAVAVRTGSDGAPSIQPLFHCAKACLAVPVDFGVEPDRIVLVLFGTGIRGRSDLAAVALELDGRTLPAQFAGAQPDSPGLDQINIELPRSLAGRGLVTATLRVDGQAANPIILDFGLSLN